MQTSMLCWRSLGRLAHPWFAFGLKVNGQGLATLLVNVLKVCKDDLVQGAMISVTENGPGLEGFLSCDKLFRRDCARSQI
jgi:hypothetical protein